MAYYWSSLLLIVIVTFGTYCYLFKQFNFFKRHNVLHIPSLPVFGVTMPVIFHQESVSEFLQRLYNFLPDAKYYGFYATTLPVLLLREPELIKNVLIRDFESFQNRRPFADVNDPLINRNLFSLQDKEWHNVRVLLSPAFTVVKIKFMFSLISECAVNFATFMSSLPADQNELDMKEAFTKYANDVIARCAFGIKMDSMRDPTNKFYLYSRSSTSFLKSRIVFLSFLGTFSLRRIFNLRLVNEQVTSFFINATRNVIARRDAENITYPDMLQLMMNVRGKADKELNLEDMTAQIFVFFFGGLESISTTLSFSAHELAVNPDVQAKLRREIDDTLKETNDQVTLDTINKLKYLDAVIKETIRMYPPNSFTERVCVKDYELPPALPGEKPFFMKKDTVLWIPIYSIHRDDKYYDEPEKFCPERFMGNTENENSPYYLPFGLGPRMCIGKRFAMLELKLLLFHLLAQCELRPCAKTSVPLQLDTKGLQMVAKGGFWLSVLPRSDAHPALASAMIND